MTSGGGRTDIRGTTSGFTACCRRSANSEGVVLVMLGRWRWQCRSWSSCSCCRCTVTKRWRTGHGRRESRTWRNSATAKISGFYVLPQIKLMFKDRLKFQIWLMSPENYKPYRNLEQLNRHLNVVTFCIVWQLKPKHKSVPGMLIHLSANIDILWD